jgi:GTPase SAR1 family protein
MDLAFEKPNFILNLAIIGDSKVGKTSFIMRITNEVPNSSNVYTKKIILDKLLFEINFMEINNLDVLAKNYNSFNGIIIICDIENINSYNIIKELRVLNNIYNVKEDFPTIMILNNKIDRYGMMDYNKIENYQFIINNIKNYYLFYDISSLLNINILTSFEIFLRKIKNKTNYSLEISSPSFTYKLLDDDKKSCLNCNKCSCIIS